MRQRTLAMMTGFERYSKKTRRAQFLEEMQELAPRELRRNQLHSLSFL
jgi:hypothetical protein